MTGTARTTRSRKGRAARTARKRAAGFVLWLALLALGNRAGNLWADTFELPREAAPDPGTRFVPARDRDATSLRAEILPEARARALLGRAPRGSLVAVTMDYPHPDTGEARKGRLVYETEGDLFRRIRPELGGYAGPAFKALAAEFRARGMRRSASRLAEAPHYRLEPDVTLSLRVERRLSSVADGYYDRTGREVTVTSGTRDAASQARAMHTKFELGDDVVGLYGGRPMVLEIEAAYEKARMEGKPARAVREAIEDTIRAQMARGDYISSHLRAGAVDIRSRGLSPSQKRALNQSARDVPNVRLLEEKVPPHFHMQVLDPEP